MSMPLSDSSVHEILSFRRVERGMYQRILSLGSPAAVAQTVVALWIWLEFIGINIIEYINDCHNNSVVQQYLAEAEFILQCLRTSGPPPADRRVAIPFTASLATEQLNLRFFYCHRDVVGRGLAYILDGIGTIIFNDNLNALFSGYQTARRAVLPLELARPYNSRVVPNPEDFRSAFITFPDRHPLRREDILGFFQGRWSDCVENLIIEQTAPGVAPLYGRVVFKNKSFMERVLNNEYLVRMEIRGSPVWLRKYIPRNN